MDSSPVSKLSGRKIALMSDIHGNFHAFRACFDDAIRHGAEGFLFLGDYISDLAEPEKTMDLLYEIQAAYPTVCLGGNRERYMLERERGETSFVPGSRSGSLLFTFQHLRKRDLDFFRGLKISGTIALNGIPVEMAHAAMDNDRFYFDSTDGNASQIFPNMKCDYLLTGHSHKQFALQESGKTILNPGSVGLPHDGSPLAQYALLETCQGAISWELRQVEYDLEAVVRAQFARGLVDCAQYWAIGILYDVLTGEEWVMRLLNRVLEAGDPKDEALWRSAAMAMRMRESEAEILDLLVSCGAIHNRMKEKMFEEEKKMDANIEKIMVERFGKDSIVALATTADNRPYVRSVDAFYDNGSFYVLTYGLSKKMQQIQQNPFVAISGEWFTANGTGINLGYFGKKENSEVAEKMKIVFSVWINNGHNNFEDENTCILQIKLTDGVLFSNGTRYDIDFTKWA